MLLGGDLFPDSSLTIHWELSVWIVPRRRIDCAWLDFTRPPNLPSRCVPSCRRFVLHQLHEEILAGLCP